MVKDVSPVENALVTRSNKLIESRYKLSLKEQKIVYSIISLLSPDDEAFSVFRFKVADLAKFCNMNAKSAYREMEEATRLLLTRVITIKEGNLRIQSHWVQSAVYAEGEGVVTFDIDEKLRPYLLGLKAVFTEMKVSELMSFKSQYAGRLYELLYQRRSFGNRKFLFEDFKYMLGLDKKEYPLYGHIRARIIDPAIKDICKKTPYVVTYETEKKGLKVVGLTFYIKRKPLQGEETLGDDLFAEEPLAPAAAPTLSPLMREFTQLLGPDTAALWIEQEGEGFCLANYNYTKNHCKKPAAMGAYLLKALKGNYDKYYKPIPKPVSVPVAVADPEPKKPDLKADPDCPKCHGEGRYKDVKELRITMCDCLK